MLRKEGRRLLTVRALLGPSSLPERPPNKLLSSDSPSKLTPTARSEQRPAGQNEICGLPWRRGEGGAASVPGPSSLAIPAGPRVQPRRRGDWLREGQARRSGPSGLQQGDASFPAKLEGGGSEHARPHPGAKGTSASRGAAARLARRDRSGSGSQERRLQGLGARRGLRPRPRPQRFCAALRTPARSLRFLLQTPAPSHGAPAFPPCPGPARGTLAEPGSRGPAPAARQEGKVGSRGAG